MALIDNALMLADAVAVSASGIVGAGINFGYSDVGSGKELTLVIISNSTGTGATASNSFYYQLRTADASGDVATGTILWQSPVVAGDAHGAGVVMWQVALPPGACKARIGLYAVEAGTAAVNLTAFVVGDQWQVPAGMRVAPTAAS